MANDVRLASPWVSLYHKFEALFDGDDDVHVDYVAGDGEDPVIKLYVEGADKADALQRLLNDVFTFGNTTVTVEVKMTNSVRETQADLFRRAFEGNPALSYVTTVDGLFGNMSYVVFRNKVVQYYNDDLSDINGNETTLYESIAKDLFDDSPGVSFCTDLPGNVGMPPAKRA